MFSKVIDQIKFYQSSYKSCILHPLSLFLPKFLTFKLMISYTERFINLSIFLLSELLWIKMVCPFSNHLVNYGMDPLIQVYGPLKETSEVYIKRIPHYYLTVYVCWDINIMYLNFNILGEGFHYWCLSYNNLNVK